MPGIKPEIDIPRRVLTVPAKKCLGLIWEEGAG
jgi:hypothetical protein